MPPGVVSFTVHSGLPPVSHLTRCHLSVGSDQSRPSHQSFGHRQKRIKNTAMGFPAQPRGRRWEFCSVWLSDAVIANRFLWYWNRYTEKKVTIFLIWVWSRDSHSQWGPVLLVQCEVYWVKADVRSRRGVKRRERKRELAQSTSHTFSPSSAFSHTLSLFTTFFSVSASSVSSAAFPFSIFPLFFLTNVTFHS